jgi:hypothetical protein
MTTSTTSPLESAIRQAGEGWILDSYAPPAEAIEHVRGVLAKAHQLARDRLKGNAPDLSESAIVADFQRHALQVKGFFQALGAARTPEMLLMAWRIIQGMSIKDVQLSYRMQESFKLRVILVSPYDVEDPPYESTDINDFALLRHIGILEISGWPVFDGFYPLRVREK